ncbi:hypothetical protein FRC19_010730 [Serendipita sp. 401]|nr:hypothetical protein FRC19_010730 [Serendipita sp. 401]
MSSELVDRISPLIYTILRSPNTVSSQVTAKSVRKTLINEHGISQDDIQNNKQEVNDRILAIFREVFPDVGNGAEESVPAAREQVQQTPGKRKYEDSLSVPKSTVAPSSPAVPLVEQSKKKRRKEMSEDEDEDVARRLQQAYNDDRTTRGSTSGSNKRKKTATSSEVGKGKKGKVKSKAFVEDDEEGGDSVGSGTEGRKKGKREGGGEAKGGFSKPMILSDELAELVAATTLPRPQVVKRLWEYIKDHQLQKASDKRVIICDTKLEKIFKVPEIGMFQMNKVLSNHMRTAEE